MSISFFFFFHFISLFGSGWSFLILLISLEFRTFFLCYLQSTFEPHPVIFKSQLLLLFFFLTFSSKISPWHHFIYFISDFLDFFFMYLKRLQIAMEALL